MRMNQRGLQLTNGSQTYGEIQCGKDMITLKDYTIIAVARDTKKGRNQEFFGVLPASKIKPSK